MTIKDWIDNSAPQIASAGISSSRLDAELILAHALGVNRSWVIAHGSDDINAHALKNADKLLARRLVHVPVAYLTNSKEFYGRSFIVDESVLIPRPESETLIDLLLQIYRDGTKKKEEGRRRILDVGCGSGCLGITAKLELPELSVTVADISEPALVVARKNARTLGAKPLRYVQSDLLTHWLSHDHPKQFDMIVANLPYVNPSWQRSPETDHEPALALFADDDGLSLIKKCIRQSRKILSDDGYLLLEADPCQHEAIVTYGKDNGFRMIKARDYAVVLQRVTS
jgi:release factor glutamine methyltransferase